MKLTDRIEDKGWELLWVAHDSVEPFVPWILMLAGVGTLVIAVGLAMASLQKVFLACC